jgi:hypothetical protein
MISLKYSPCCAEVAAIMERKTDAENNFMLALLYSFKRYAIELVGIIVCERISEILIFDDKTLAIVLIDRSEE